MLFPHKPLCSVERPSKHRVGLSGATGETAISFPFTIVADGLDLGKDVGNCCGITAAVADVMPSLRATVIRP